MRHLRLSIIVCAILGAICAGQAGARIRSAARPAPQRREVARARTMYSKAFIEGDTHTIEISNVPRHYRDAKGKWREIRTAIEPAAGERDLHGKAFAFRAVENSLPVYFPRTADGWVQLRAGAGSLCFCLVGAGNKALRRRGESELVAKNIMAGADLRFRVEAGRLKEEIVLKSPDAPMTFEYAVKLKNLTVAGEENGEFVFSAGPDQPALAMSRFVMYDGRGARSDEIEVSLERDGGDYRLLVAPDRSWLLSPERVYPVAIDPTAYVIDMDGDNSRGAHNTYYMYIPCLSPTESTLSFGGLGDDQSHHINTLADVYTYPYKIRVNYTITFGDDATLEKCRDKPYFKAFICTNEGGAWLEQDTPVVSEQFRGGTSSGWFDIDSGACAKLVVDTGHTTDLFGGTEGYRCRLSFSYQNEICSPPPPSLSPLPPETYGTSVELKWVEPEDVVNEDALPGIGPSGVVKYIVQRSTDPAFAADVVNTEVSAPATSCTQSGLSIGSTYYFRVFAQDWDGNPTSIESWDPETNPSGARWSAVVRTKCVTPPVPGGPPTPVIEEIRPPLPAHYFPGEDCFYTPIRNPIVDWSDPPPVPADFIQISAGQNHCVALREDGTVWTWGQNTYGQLGNNTNTDVEFPVQVITATGIPFTGAIAVAAGSYHTLAVKNDGTVWAWGRNNYGQLGNGTNGANTDTTTPVQVGAGTDNLADITAVAAGQYHSLALKSDGTVWAWGYNSLGQLGDNTTTLRNTATQVRESSSSFLTGTTRIAAGYSHSLACKADGTAWAWGSNASGQIGIGTTTSSYKVAKQMKTSSSVMLTSVCSVSGGASHTLVLKTDGTVYSCGLNSTGQLGIYSTTLQRYAVQVHGLDNVGYIGDVVQIACGSGHSLCRKSDGTVYAWGYNALCQLGDGTTSNKLVPVLVNQVSGGQMAGVSSIAAGGNQSWALKDGAAWMWGWRLGYPESSPTPAMIAGASVARALSTAQVEAQVSVVEMPASYKPFVEYPIITIPSTASQAQSNWNLADGRYALHVKVKNNVDWSEWSEGKSLVIDTIPPVLHARNDTPTQAPITVSLHLTSNEPIRYSLYWGDNPDQLTLHSSSDGYGTQFAPAVADADLLTKPHYYRFDCWDKAGNAASTDVYCVTQVTSLGATATITGGIPVYTVAIDVVGVPWADRYKYYRKDADDVVVCLTPEGIPESTYQDQTATKHCIYEYGYTVIDHAGIESALQWADGRTVVSPGELAPKVYIPNIKPVEKVTHEPSAATNPTLHFTLGSARDDEDDQLVYHAYYTKDGGIEVSGGQCAPDADDLDMTVHLPGPGTYTWRVTCVEREPGIIDRVPVDAGQSSGSITIEQPDSMEISGDISGQFHVDRIYIVPAGSTLRFLPDTQITADPGCGVIIRGDLQVGSSVTFNLNQNTSRPGDTWLGIAFEAGGTGSFSGTPDGSIIISNAARGVTCAGAGTISLSHVAFTENTVGLHCLGGTVTVDHCGFTSNTIYGIKEDADGNPIVTNCIFENNGMAYYDTVMTELTEMELNEQPNNDENEIK